LTAKYTLNSKGKHTEDEDNYAYFPIIVEDGFALDRDALCEKLKENNIYARKYFYPLISEFPVYQAYYAETPIAKELSDKVLCLPMYPHLQPEVCEYIANVIKSIK
jgi:dTDP-4-amino-4,6-dideoxygalactose transaminase